MSDKYADYKDELPSFVTSEADFEVYKIRHSSEHILHQAVQNLFGVDNVIAAMGPATEDGFYFDFELKNGVSISEMDFEKIEAEMKRLIKSNLKFEKSDISKSEASKLFKNNPYKMEWVSEYGDKGLTIYKTGEDFVDLCKGPHIDYTSRIGAFKLLRIAGAYWHGDEKNKMLTRIYGTAFKNSTQLNEYLAIQEEAKKRDHRKLGKELDLFVFSDVVGKGLPLWTPRGSIIRRELEKFIVDEEIKRGYQHVYTPDIARIQLYEKSGHYPYYKDSMYAPIEDEEEKFMLRPMTCPHHFELYLSKPRSYKELPMRIAELAQLYRYEKSGELSGLVRVRSFCLADAHIVAKPDQAKKEINDVLDLIGFVSEIFGLKPGTDYRYRLSLGDRKDDKKYFKDDKAWDFAEDVLRSVLIDRKASYYEAEGEAAFYGPKIDVQMRNIFGKEDTAFTVQYDFVMPKRFALNYTDSDGKEKESIVIHRSSIGAIERVMAYLIELYAGAFPAWLSPEQVAIIPISVQNNAYAQKLADSLKEKGIRVELELDDERMQNKIRKSQEKKIPYMLICGKAEEESNTVSLRYRDGKEIKGVKFEDFESKLLENVKLKNVNINLL
jgi:threonyl-tRNA synthetase